MSQTRTFMRRTSAFSLVVLFGWVAFAHGQTAATVPSPSLERSVVSEYCVGCHNERLRRGDLVLSGLDVPPAEAATWEKVIRKVRAGMMPPPGARRPDAAKVEAFASALEATLDKAAATTPNPGRPALHRLNRTEYASSIRDLLGLDINVASLLPPDDMTHGFDNIADVLNISPTLMESYIRAAGGIARLAVGDPAISPKVETYRVTQMLAQNDHVEGTPLGTRGGIAVRHFFPADGEYVFKIAFYHELDGALFGTLQKGEQLEVAIDGERVALLDVNPKVLITDELRTQSLKVSAGPKLLSASFVMRAQGPAIDFVTKFETTLINVSAEGPGVTALPHVNSLGVSGPNNVTGPGDTPSRRKIFACRPATRQDEVPCARKILSMLARQAYRRPPAASDVNPLMQLYQAGRNQGDFEAGVRLGLQGILSAPEFVFRFERPPANVAPGAIYAISDLELATRLSYFLWSSGPDEILIDLASRGKLRAPAVLEQQVRRMLDDARSEALAKNFASQWLHLRNLRDWHPDPYVFPNADQSLIRSMERETELFFMSIVREDRNIIDMLGADYTFVDGRLAKHYKIPNVVGNRFRRVTITDETRRGLLGHASILAVSSFPNRTSPVVRGKWVLDTLLGAPPPQPPPDVPALTENTHDAKPLPLRARLEKHRANPTCAACHAVMDPIGFALEKFDAVGASRTYDSGERIDPSGQLADGTKLDGVVGLRQVLLSRSGLFTRAFTEKLLIYALGRGVEYYDMPVVRSIVRAADKDNNRFSAFVLGVVNSMPFQMRKAEDISSAEPTTNSDRSRVAAVNGRTRVQPSK